MNHPDRAGHPGAGDAWSRAERLVAASNAHNFSQMLDAFAEALGARIHFVANDDDLQELTQFCRGDEKLGALAEFEFEHRGCDAVVIRSTPDRTGAEHLIVVDARGERWWRAYFSAWHEVAHLLVGLEAHPNADDPDFEASFGALERAVDQLAAHLAFHPTLFDPLIRRLLPERHLSFASIERVRGAVHPNASLYATAIACVSRWPQPVQLIGVTGEHAGALKVEQVTFSRTAQEAGLRILPPISVPMASIIRQVHGTRGEAEAEAAEDQRWWSTLDGALPALRVRVRVVSRADHTYAILWPGG